MLVLQLVVALLQPGGEHRAQPGIGAGASLASACRASDANALVLRSYLRQLVSATDAERAVLRRGIGLAASDSSKVVLVTTTRICDNVGTGINTAFKTPSLARSLYVFRVGASYVAQDPGHPAGQWAPLIVLDGRYVYQGSVLAQ
jgi:hypothetical protein